MVKLFSMILPIHPEGIKFVTIFALVSLVLFLIAEPLGWIGVILTLWCYWFFRNPARIVPQNEGLIISPADGVVNLITTTSLPPELGLDDSDERICISVFMNVFNCHINRMPHHAKILKSLYRTGKFLNASVDKASELNERQTLHVELPDGKDMVVVQIAGLIARRILCWSKEGDTLKTGERFGLIRFGSRVDVYLPKGAVPCVAVGQTAVGGETILARLNSDELLEIEVV